MTGEPAVGASAPLRMKSKVVEIQGWIRQHVGEGVQATVEWDRTGAQTIELLGGDRGQWTAINLFGRTGCLRMSAPESNLPVEDPELRYEVRGNDLMVDLHCLARGLAGRMSPASSSSEAVGAGSAVGFPALTGLMTIFSILSFLWTLLHSSVSLILPGTIGCQAVLKGDTLTLDLLRPLPSLRIRIMFEVTPSLSRVIITPDKIRVEFQGSIVREREFPLV